MWEFSVGRRLGSVLALVGWLGLSGFGEAAELAARALGTHGECQMACCRGRQDACPRMAGGSSHHGPHRARHEKQRPMSDRSVAAKSSCEEACALLQSVGRHDTELGSNAVATTRPAARVSVTATRTKFPTPRFLESLPSRAPPA